MAGRRPTQDKATPAPDAAAEQPQDTPPASDLTPQVPPADSLWASLENGVLSQAQLAGLELLRQAMPEHLLALKPINVGKTGDKTTCRTCGSYTYRHTQHLTFAGHAAITDRLLAADPAWRWDPVPNPQERGLPTMANTLWIELTVCGVTRYGFGDSEGKTGPNAVKEVIGDALRNAAMRFGVGLELWHKGDLHADAPAAEQHQAPATAPQQAPAAPQGQAPASPPEQPMDAPQDAQGYVDAMLRLDSPAATIGLQRQAFEAGFIDQEVTLPTTPPSKVTLLEAFDQRKRYLGSRQQVAAEQAAQG